MPRARSSPRTSTGCRCPAIVRWSSSASPIGARRVVVAQPAQERRLVELGREDVRPEHREAAVEARARLGQQLEHRPVELDDLARVGAQDEPGAAARAAPALAVAVRAPRAGHAQVRVDRQVALEAHEEVLAVRVDARRPRGRRASRASARRASAGAGCAISGHLTLEERADPARRVVDRVALGHGVVQSRTHGARRDRRARRASSARSTCEAGARRRRPSAVRRRAGRRSCRPADARRGRRGRRLVLRARRRDRAARRRQRATPAARRCRSGAAAIALSLERLRPVRSFEPVLWRMEAEAGVTTATVARLARENGLLFPPDPGAAEQSQIGGNDRDERRRPARVQVRRDRRLGDRPRGGARARRARARRRRRCARTSRATTCARC